MGGPAHHPLPLGLIKEPLHLLICATGGLPNSNRPGKGRRGYVCGGGGEGGGGRRGRRGRGLIAMSVQTTANWSKVPSGVGSQD